MLKCIEMQDLHTISFNSSFFLVTFIFYFINFGKKIRIKFKSWFRLKGRLVMLQPHFWKSVRMTLTFPKWELGSPPGLLKLQSSIVGVKTPRLEALFMSLESY